MADMDDESDKRDRSPKFPYINLTLALERAQRVFAATRANPVRLIDIASDWGISPTSSTTLRVAAAMLSYGLITDEGSGDSRRIRLTPDAIRILNDSRPGVREELLAVCALRAPIIEEYFLKWGRERPSDAHAVSTLKFDSGFTERAARTFLGVYDDVIEYIPREVSQTSKPLDEHIENDRGLEQANPRLQPIDSFAQALPLTNEKGSPIEREWLRVRVSKEVTARVLVDGDLNQRMIERLISVLGAQKEVMDDDF